jgi:hypothetical protein
MKRVSFGIGDTFGILNEIANLLPPDSSISINPIGPVYKGLEIVMSRKCLNTESALIND